LAGVSLANDKNYSHSLSRTGTSVIGATTALSAPRRWPKDVQDDSLSVSDDFADVLASFARTLVQSHQVSIVRALILRNFGHMAK
jgi:hypothetical protein